MSTSETNRKVTAAHLRKDAYLYVRQSTVRQVFENQESTKRQYALRERAVALGWPMERVHVIDSDLGQSGASAKDREGFKELVTAVSLGNAGIVLGLEVSRLARNCSDWHRLLELCALSDTLILDEDGLYNPNDFNDRLLLGMKGAMSEAELHMLRARLRGGILNKARRGELPGPLPLGFLYDEQQKVRLDPDRQVQESIRTVFQTFRRAGSAMQVVRHFREQHLLFPRRLRTGATKGTLVWGELCHHRVLQLLHNPRYAGAFFFGRTRTRSLPDGGQVVLKMPRDEWQALVQDVHDKYISWDEFEDNQRHLLANAKAHGGDRRRSPPGEGPALLQGLVICGCCGQRMSLRYHMRHGRQIPDYYCQRDGIEHARQFCQRVPGQTLDAAIGQLLLEKLTPLTVEIALTVQQELQAQLQEADHLRRQQVERARTDADLAQRRYMQVDPGNRLVADVLEAEWNGKLRALQDAQEEYEHRRQADRLQINEQLRAQLMELTHDFPRVWQDPRTSDRDRKRMVRLLVEDVTLIKTDQITAHVRFKGGTTTTISLPLPLEVGVLFKTPALVVTEIDRLLSDHTEDEIAELLNQQELRSGRNHPFTPQRVAHIRRNFGLKNRYTRLRERGLLTVKEMATTLDIHPTTVKQWRRSGKLTAQRCNRRNDYLFDPPGSHVPKKYSYRWQVASERTNEVQHET